MGIALSKRGKATQIDYFNEGVLYDSDVIKGDVRFKVQRALTNSPYIELVGTGIELKIDEIQGQTFANIFEMRDFLIAGKFFNGEDGSGNYVGGFSKFNGESTSVTVVHPNIVAGDTIVTSPSQSANETFSVPVASNGSFTMTRSRSSQLTPFVGGAGFTWYVE